MNKFLTFIFLLFLISACKKDDPVPTTYHVVNKMEHDPNSTVEYLDGTLWEVTVFCLDESGDVVREDNLDPIPADGGKSIEKEVTPNIVKVVVSFKFLPPESIFYDLSTNNRRFTVTRFPLAPETDNEIVINGNTSIKGTLSIVNNLSEDFAQTSINLK